MERVSDIDIMNVLRELNRRTGEFLDLLDITRDIELTKMCESRSPNWIHELAVQAVRTSFITYDQSRLFEMLLNHPEEFRIWMRTLIYD